MGDSQTAALKHGWTRIAPQFPDVEITFFAGIGTEWPSIRAEDGTLVPGSERLREEFRRSSRGLEAIAGDFDAYILTGLRLAISFPLRLWTHHEHADWAAYRAAVSAYLRETGMATVLARLRAITEARVLLLDGPHQPHDFCKASPLLDRETIAKLHANFVRECEALAAEYGARFIAQPEETLAPNGITTQMKYAAISKDPEREDRRHCNAEYGAIAMRHVLAEGLGLHPRPD